MRVYEYKDYDDYVEAQTWTNKEKLTWRYVKPHTIKRICEHKPYPAFIICHGTRNGTEQKYFKDNYPNAYVIGTEISETATQFPMTLHHDFTFPIEKWIGKADIVYSNSFDHTIDPEKIIANYGADAVRLFILSDSPPEKDVQWSDQGMLASYKFIQKFWQNIFLQHCVKNIYLLQCGLRPPN